VADPANQRNIGDGKGMDRMGIGWENNGTGMNGI
jgi:hypothetical protein